MPSVRSRSTPVSPGSPFGVWPLRAGRTASLASHLLVGVFVATFLSVFAAAWLRAEVSIAVCEGWPLHDPQSASIGAAFPVSPEDDMPASPDDLGDGWLNRNPRQNAVLPRQSRSDGTRCTTSEERRGRQTHLSASLAAESSWRLLSPEYVTVSVVRHKGHSDVRTSPLRGPPFVVVVRGVRHPDVGVPRTGAVFRRSSRAASGPSADNTLVSEPRDQRARLLFLRGQSQHTGLPDEPVPGSSMLTKGRPGWTSSSSWSSGQFRRPEKRGSASI